jgi:ABC-type sugar transport system permease subunit
MAITMDQPSIPRVAVRKKRQRFQPFVLWLVPVLLLLLVFNVLPIFGSFFLSLFDYEMLQPLKFVGLQNFITALTHDPIFPTTFRNTVYFSFVSVPVGMAISLLVAQFIFGRTYLKSFFRTVYFLPFVTPTVAVAIVWAFIFQASKFGFLNGILGMFNLPSYPWLTNSTLVIPSIMVLTIWGGLGYNMVLFLAGLGGIPVTFYEAAKIDGANAWQSFWRITFPLLSPTLLFTTVTGSISALQIFTQPYIMTKGGPENASRMVVMYIQDVGFSQFRMGYASSISVIFFLFILILTVIQLRWLRVRWSY